MAPVAMPGPQMMAPNAMLAPPQRSTQMMAQPMGDTAAHLKVMTQQPFKCCGVKPQSNTMCHDFNHSQGIRLDF